MTWVLITALVVALLSWCFRKLHMIAVKASAMVEENEPAAHQFLAALRRTELDENARKLGVQRVLIAPAVFEKQHYAYLMALVPAYSVEAKSLVTHRDMRRVAAELDAALMFVADEAPILESADFFTLVRGHTTLKGVVEAGQARIEEVHAFLLEV